MRVSHLVQRRLHLLLFAVEVGSLFARRLEARVHLLPRVLHTLHLVRARMGVVGGGRGCTEVYGSARGCKGVHGDARGR